MSLSDIPAYLTESQIELVREGGLVIFPTETIYGIGCRADNSNALERLFAAKGRRPDQPPPVLVSSAEQLELLTTAIPNSARELMRLHWPGSLTLILPARTGLPTLLTAHSAHGPTIGVRRTGHPIAQALCEAVGFPIVATSANFSGATVEAAAPHRISDIAPELLMRVTVVIDGGPVAGQPSTVVDCTTEPPRVLREGAVRISFPIA